MGLGQGAKPVRFDQIGNQTPRRRQITRLGGIEIGMFLDLVN
jgi:hypothetical protein